MVFRRKSAGNLLISSGAAAALMGCAMTPLGPTVSVMPGHGKSFDAFQSDQASCKSFAAGQVQGQADVANQRAVGTAVLSTLLTAGLGAAVGSVAGDAGAGAGVGSALGAAGGTAFGATNTSADQMNIQQQYDNAFSQCMYSKGEQVPGFAPHLAGGGGPDPLVQSTQSELIRLGYLHSSADGYIGQQTRSAISMFEQANGMPPDGAPSPQLLARLQSTTSGGSGATASSGGWVTPGASSRSTTTASGSSDWVAPGGAPAVTPAASTSGGWVSPSK